MDIHNPLVQMSNLDLYSAGPARALPAAALFIDGAAWCRCPFLVRGEEEPMRHVLSSLVVLSLSLGMAWAAEAPAAPATPALDFGALFGAQPASDPLCPTPPPGYSCTYVTHCDPNHVCSNQTGSGNVYTLSCRCCSSTFPPDCETTLLGVSCGC